MTRDLRLLAASLFCWGIGEGGFRVAHSLMNAGVEQRVHPSELGLSYGLAETVFGVAIVIGAPLAGLLYRAHPAAPFPIALGLIALALGLTVSGRFGIREPSSPAALQASLSEESRP